VQSDRQTTRRRRAKQALRDHEAGLRRAQQMAKLAHVITGPAGEFLEWSDTLPAMIGCDSAAMPGSTRAWLDLLHPEDRERFRRTSIEAGKIGARTELEYRLKRSPDEWVHIRQVMEPLDSEQDTSAGRRWFNTLQDVTAAKQAAHALQESEQRYRATFEQAAVGIVHSSLEGRLRLVNQAFCAMTGYSRAEALQIYIRDVTHPEDMGPSTERRAKLTEGSGTPYRRELRILRKDGSYLWICVTTSLVRASDGRPLYFVSVLSDISERKRAEEDLTRFHAAMDVSVESIFLTDPKAMRLLYVNETACRRLGYTRTQLMQKPPFELVGKTREQLSREDDEVIAAGEDGTRTETRYVRGDGSAEWNELYRRALRTESGMVIVTIARDITERKAQQEKIERLTRVHAMLSGINAAIVRIRDRQELFEESCRIAFEVGGLPYAYCRCDALVVATPTGSTAYSYAAGGPVVSSSARVTVITPVAPMAGISRSIVFPADSELSVHLHAEQDEAALELDGRLRGFIQAGDTIAVESVRGAGLVVRFEPGTFASQQAVKLSLLDLPVRGDDVEELLRWELLRRAEVVRRTVPPSTASRGASTPRKPDA